MRKGIANYILILEVFDLFQCSITKVLHTFIDTMLVKFKGNSRFRVHIKDKPGKYDLLSRMITDANVRYVLNIVP